MHLGLNTMVGIRRLNSSERMYMMHTKLRLILSECTDIDCIHLGLNIDCMHLPEHLGRKSDIDIDCMHSPDPKAQRLTSPEGLHMHIKLVLQPGIQRLTSSEYTQDNSICLTTQISIPLTLTQTQIKNKTQVNRALVFSIYSITIKPSSCTMCCVTEVLTLIFTDSSIIQENRKAMPLAGKFQGGVTRVSNKIEGIFYSYFTIKLSSYTMHCVTEVLTPIFTDSSSMIIENRKVMPLVGTLQGDVTRVLSLSLIHI